MPIHTPASRTLILLDVDGVLVHPVGYKAALRATMDRFAAHMGQPSLGVTDDVIAVFEACGLTNEWDSGAMCASALLLAALDTRPDLRRPTLDDTLAAIHAAGLTVHPPDFAAVARDLAQYDGDGAAPSTHYLALLADRTDSANLPLVSALLDDVYDVLNTLTTRIFQTHTLGSERFAATYGAPAPFESESYLTTYDTRLLSEQNRARLAAWRAAPDGGVAIFTARPSLPPADLPDDGYSTTGYAPEGELAAELIDLAGHVPLIGQGRVAWLAQQNGRVSVEYVKPSPVQALAAIGAAASGTETDALLAAADLYERDIVSGPLAALDGPVRVVVLEDSTGGIRATQRATELLVSAGLDVTFDAIGVSPHADKRAALATVAGHVVDDVNAALALIWD